MIENGLYVVKKELLEIIDSLGGDCAINNGDKRDLRSCYYHVAMTTKEALYKISSCYPITEKYIDHEFISNGKHVIMRKQNDINEIRRKFINLSKKSLVSVFS